MSDVYEDVKDGISVLFVLMGIFGRLCLIGWLAFFIPLMVDEIYSYNFFTFLLVVIPFYLIIRKPGWMKKNKKVEN